MDDTKNMPAEAAQETLQGSVLRIRYRNEQNGYAILSIQPKEGQPFTAVGYFPPVREGMQLSMSGGWTTHPTYGKQFKVDASQEVIPDSIPGMVGYLSSGMVKGIGPAYAQAIVDAFGEQTFDVIDNHPEKLLTVHGIGKGRAKQILSSWREHKEVRNVMMFLQSLGVGTAYAAKIYKKFGKRSIELVKRNPYSLTMVWGIGFKIADGVADALGIRADDLFRCRSGVLYTLETLGARGHVYAGRHQLMKAAQGILGLVDPGPVLQAIENLKEDGSVACDGDAVYLPKYYMAETYCASKLARMCRCGCRMPALSVREMTLLQTSLGVSYDDVQKEAIQKSSSSGVLVLTGGPGTGKTTTINGIIRRFGKRKILLAAPTGRAAKRMSEVTGCPSETIHRLLEYGNGGFQRNEDQPLTGDVLVVDEASMIDITLLESLLKAVPDRMTVIFSGDVDQLPSVGPGNVLKDMINSSSVPVVRLTRIFRQAQASDIVLNAHRINRGEKLVVTNRADSDFFWQCREDAQSVQDTVVDLVARKLPAYYHVSPADIQVLSPMRGGLEGVEALNQRLQEEVNPDGAAAPYRNRMFRVHDKVMQLRNNYDKEVFNGDVGVVDGFDTGTGTLNVCFGGRSVAYESGELDELALAYACTVHKSQGSEYPVVVMPVTTSHWIMLQRNLLYTGVTRAKKVFVAVGSPKAMQQAIRHVDASKRNSMLAERISQAAGHPVSRVS